MKSIETLECKLQDCETNHNILQMKHETLLAAHATLDQSNMALVTNMANAKLKISKAWEKSGLSLTSILPLQPVLTPPLFVIEQERKEKDKFQANLDSLSEVLDQRAAEVSSIRNQLGVSNISLTFLTSHLI